MTPPELSTNESAVVFFFLLQLRIRYVFVFCFLSAHQLKEVNCFRVSVPYSRGAGPPERSIQAPGKYLVPTGASLEVILLTTALLLVALMFAQAGKG